MGCINRSMEQIEERKMKVTRKETWNAFNENWCPICAMKVEIIPIVTGLPGISAWGCPTCKSQYQANFLEDAEDILEIPDNFVMEIK